MIRGRERKSDFTHCICLGTAIKALFTTLPQSSLHAWEEIGSSHISKSQYCLHTDSAYSWLSQFSSMCMPDCLFAFCLFLRFCFNYIFPVLFSPSSPPIYTRLCFPSSSTIIVCIYVFVYTYVFWDKTWWVNIVLLVCMIFQGCSSLCSVENYLASLHALWHVCGCALCSAHVWVVTIGETLCV